MFSKSLYWMRRHMKSVKFAAFLSMAVLIVAVGIVQASGPMRPQPPMRPGGMGMWGHVRRVWYPMEPVPTIKIIAVVRDQSVTFETSDFPEDEDFTVTMGYMYTRGVNGIEVGTFNSGDGESMQQTFEIPEELQGQYRIAIRAQTDHTFPYYAFNWFYNNTTETTAAPVADAESETATAEETEEAETEETAEAETEETEEAGTGEAAGELTGQVWQWVEITDPVQGAQEVPNPESYQVEFLPEGGMNIQADCNVGTGSYTAEDGSLNVSLGAMTLALCPEGSLGDDFVNYLSSAAVYFFGEDGALYVDMAADAGTLKFQVAGEATAEAGVGGAEETEEAEMAEEPGSIADIAASDEQFSTLVTALQAAGLAETLAGEGEFTVFAPTNDAFDALPEGSLDALLADPEGALTDVLLYHVVEGVVPAADVVALESADTLQGEAIAISVVDDEVLLNDTVTVILTDIEASNGIIHVIDGVLLPPGMSEAETTEGEATETEEAEGEAEEPTEEIGLVGGVWQWTEFTDPVNGTTTIENPANYTVEFLEDGTVNVQADCNSGFGGYTVEDSSITIGELALTRAICEEGSRSDDFVMFLQSAAIFFFQDGNLYMDLPADSGTMMFVPAQSEEAMLFRGASMKVAAQNGDEEEIPVPSFQICTVVQNETVAILTADFPEGETFNVTMGPVLVYQPMKPEYGPMPMGKPEYMPGNVDPKYMGPPQGGMEWGGPQGGTQWGAPQGGMQWGPPKGGMDMGMKGGDMWAKPMPPKSYVPFYYEAGTLESQGGSFEAEFEIPAELAGYYRIQVMLRTEHQFPYFAYNWFYNNDAEVCNGVENDN